VLTFDERKTRRSFLREITDRMIYEEWILPVRLIPDSARASGMVVLVSSLCCVGLAGHTGPGPPGADTLKLESVMRNILRRMLDDLSSKREHLPALVSGSKTEYCYEVCVCVRVCSD
jgi:hypothetical protein